MDWNDKGSPTDIGNKSLNGYERNVLYWNGGASKFYNVAHLANADRIEDGRGVAVADFDRDGRLDMLIQNFDQPAVLLMGRGEGGHWLQIELEGVESNRNAVGATLRIRSESGSQSQLISVGAGFLSSSSQVAHFGLGSDTVVTHLEVIWPSGLHQKFENLQTDRRYRIQEGQEASVTTRP